MPNPAPMTIEDLAAAVMFVMDYKDDDGRQFSDKHKLDIIRALCTEGPKVKQPDPECGNCEGAGGWYSELTGDPVICPTCLTDEHHGV